MALNKSKLEGDILNLLSELSKQTENPEEARKKFAKDLSNVIDSYVKGGSFFASPVQITAAGMSNGGGPVVAANNLSITIT